MLSEASQDVEAIGRRIRGEESRNRRVRPARSREELRGPLDETFGAHVYIPPRLRFVDVLSLEHESERLLSTAGRVGEGECLRVSREAMEVVVALIFIGRTPFGMAPLGSRPTPRSPDRPAVTDRGQAAPPGRSLLSRTA